MPMGLTQAAIRSRTDLAAGTVSAIVSKSSKASKSLVDAGVLEPAPVERSRRAGGPRPSLWSINPEIGVILAADCGVNCVRLGAAGADGVPLAAVEQRPTTEAPRAILRTARDGLRELLEEHAGGDVSKLIGYGVSVPAAVQVTHDDEDDGAQVNDLTMRENWRTVDLRYELHQQLRWPVKPRIDNDCRYEAFAEFRYGIGPRPRYMLYLKWSRTISIAILIPPKGKVLAGSEGVAVEIGFATAPGEKAPLNEIAGTDYLLELGSEREITTSRVTEDAVKKAHAKDPDRFVRAAKAVGRTLAFAANIVNPDTIVIGGNFGRHAYDLDLGKEGDSLIRTTVEDEFHEHALPAAGKASLRGSMIPAWPHQSGGAESDEHYAALRGAITAVLTTDQPTYLLERLRR